MMREFAFVDGSKTDRSTRRYARSHAMRGKNLGKTHHRPSRLAQQPKRRELILQSQHVERQSADETGHAEESLAGSAQPLPICPSLPLPLLLETTFRGLDTIRNFFTYVVGVVYPSQLCLSLDRIISYWLRMLFVDETSYHGSLALMATLNGFVFASDAGAFEASYHLGKAVRLVNEKLDTAEALTSSSLSVVNFLVVRDIHRGEQSSAEIHFNGLRKMVELRGGLSELEADCADGTLAQKICKYRLCVSLRNSTAFYRDRMSQAARIMALSEGICPKDSVACEPMLAKTDPFLQRIVLDAIATTTWFNGNGRSRKADPDALQEIIISLGYRLVRFHALHAPQLENFTAAAYHIGLVSFITTLFMQHGQRRFFRYSLVAQALKTVIARSMHEEDSVLILWLLFIGGVSVLDEADHFWLLPRITQVTRSVGIASWPQLRSVLIRFPWIDLLHDVPGEALWEATKATAGLTS
ncbi:hypothetical protein G7046_g5233 [Stylonectria norvegica]|nr:hypothetical protein G7046_g5233 [Stylonectria norvegica]